MTTHDKIFLSGITKLEKKFAPLLLEIIVHFRSSFTDNLTTNGKDDAVRRLQLTPLSEHLTPLLLSIYKDAGLFGAKLAAKELKSLAGQKDAGFGIDEQWIADVVNYLKLHLLKFVANITDTMRQDITNTLAKAVEEGWSISRTVEELQRTDLAEARAQVIARTEIVRAANVGHSVAAQSTPYEVDKKWNAAHDHRTRESHRLIDRHVTDEYGTFKVPVIQKGAVVGYDQMLYPGDATAHPSNTINCRCRVTYLPKRDENGRLVMRQAVTARIIPLRNPSTSIPAYQIAAALKANAIVKVLLGDSETK